MSPDAAAVWERVPSVVSDTGTVRTTGAKSGIGRRLALDLAARGAVVVGLARRENLLEDACVELQKSTQASETFVCDVSDTKQLQSRLAAIEERHGRVDILINDAGVHEATSVSDDASFDACERIMATNHFGVVTGTLAVMPGMLRRCRRHHRQCVVRLGACA